MGLSTKAFSAKIALCGTSFVALAASCAMAQTSDAEDVIVVKGFRQSLASSLEEKRDANQVIDVITSEEIGQFPDQNIAEAIQRITGVQITRNNGEGESVNIRGLAANFTRVEVDGRSAAVTIDSSDPERGSVLSVFSSDLYSSIEVVKSPTAADVEGGIGGIVRLKTPDPIEIGKLTWGVDAGLTDADVRDEQEPSFNGFYSNVFADGTVGLLVAGSYEKRDRAIDKFQSNQDWDTTDDLQDDTDPVLVALSAGYLPGRLRQEKRVGEAPKWNVNAKLQFQPTDTLNLYLNGLYTSEEREEDRARIQVQFSRGRLQGGTLDASTGTLTEAQFTRQRTEFRDFTRLADITTKGLAGGFEWDSGQWLVDGEINFQSSEEDFEEYRVDHRTNRDGLGGYSIVDDPEYPVLFTAATGAALADLDLRSLNFQKRRITIEETSFELNGERLVDMPFFSSFEAGVRYASSTYERLQGQIDSGDAGGLTYADGVEFINDGTFADGFGSANLLRDWPSIDPVELYNRFPSDDAFSFNDENLYDFDEDVMAGFVMANYETQDLGDVFLRGNIGVRVVQTAYSGQGRVDVDFAGEELLLDDEASIDRDSSEVLPALNIVASASEESPLLFRGAVTRALSRPEIFRIQPGQNVNFDDNFNEVGNPDLDPFLAWQYDLGVEYYFGPDDASGFSATLFFKDVENFNVPDEFEIPASEVLAGLSLTAADLQAIDASFDPTTPVEIRTFRNAGEAEIKGLEVGFQTPFYFLPSPFDGFGMFANYTYTDSEFTDENGNAQSFPGASENAYNIVGYYEKGGFSSRLAFNHRDNFLIVPAQDDGLNAQFGDEQDRLDLALRYRFENGLRLSFDALNLTEEQNYKYYDTPQRLEDLEVEGTIYTFRIGFVH